jgi:anaerobic ribonucleoside-triphosphate reductase
MFRNFDDITKNFLGDEENTKSDYLKRENSNFIYSLALLRKNYNNFAEQQELFKILPQQLVEKYEEGEIYIHDKALSNYCCSISCKDIASLGVPTLAKNMISSKPTKNLSTLFRHFSNAVTLMSQQVSGAVMLSQMTTIVASYLFYQERYKNTPIDEDEIFRYVRHLVWELNMPLRAGSESPFSNITMEFGKPSEEIKDDYIIIGGELLKEQYKDIPTEYFNTINSAIIEVMSKSTGDHGIPFTFPLITIPIDDDFNYNNDTFLFLLEKMYNWGGVYFENFRSKPFEDEYYKALNPLIKPKDPEVSRSMCCRLNIDMSVLSRVGGGIFGSSSGSTGAVQVLNLNLNRLMTEWIQDKDEVSVEGVKKFWEVVNHDLELMQAGHMAKRNWIESHKELYPTFFAYNRDLRNYFNVFAVTGLHEGLINIGYTDGIKDPEGKMLAHEIMQKISEIVQEFIVRDNVACGIEYAPAENAGIKMARNDVKYFKKKYNRDIFVQGHGKDVFLTSGAMLPFADQNFLDQVENAAEFQAYATSGSILHHFVETVVESTLMAEYIAKIFEKPIQYLTLSPTLTSCMSCGTKYAGKDAKDVHECTNCGSDDIATFSRVIGYTKMISRKGIKVDQNGFYEGEHNFWSKARRHDWNTRHRFNEEDVREVVNG